MNTQDHQQAAERLLRSAGVLPVVAVDTIDRALRLAEALQAGGLHAIELTLRTPAALDALRALKREGGDLVIGMGTVTNAQQMRASIDAGADFLVTPGTPPALAHALVDAGIPVIPGGATPTEFMALMARGFKVCKLFPANAAGGIAMLAGLAGPLPSLKLCPTGGISDANAAEFLSQPNVLCVGGSWMVKKAWLDAGDYGKVQAAARAAAQIVNSVRA